jgi:transglutaminase-like putative cysteine protease
MKAQLFDLTHTTTYEYESDVTVAHHLLKVAPRRLGRQWRIAHAPEMTPEAAATSHYTDYFGNDVLFVTIEGAHREWRVTSRSRVAVGPGFIPDPTETPAWESVRGLCRTDRSRLALEASEFTFASPLIPIDEAFAEYARPSFTVNRPLLEAVLDLTARIHADFSFDPTATTLSTPVSDVLKQRRGVCQDFAHLQIACLRSLGLPARYVSGYLETAPPPGSTRLIGADASHAWVSVFCGEAAGWVDADPTNNLLPGERHITVAWGRDFSDVSPLRGVTLGAGGQFLEVAVDVIPLEE